MTDPTESRTHSRTGTDADTESLERALERLEVNFEVLSQSLTAADVSAEDQRHLFESVAGAVQDAFAETAGGHWEINTHSGGQITPFEPRPRRCLERTRRQRRSRRTH